MNSENTKNNETGTLSKFLCSIEVVDSDTDNDCVNQIITLHSEIRRHVGTMVQKAIHLGELLIAQKQKMQHGQFTQWIEKNLPFSARTAQNYMRLYRRREEIKNEKVSLLSDAYNIVKLPKDSLNENESDDEKKFFMTFSLYSEQKEMIEIALKLAQEHRATRSNSESISRIAYEWAQSL
jgi:hypothetical protein